MNTIITGIDNARFVEFCLQSNVEFLLVGGAAVLHYGCRRSNDGLAEIDLLIEPTSVNADRMMAVLNQVLKEAALIPHFTSEHLQQPKVQLPLKNQRHNYNLDILTPWVQLSYSGLRSRSEVGMLNSIEVRIVSREDLIILKEYAINHHESEAAKHRSDLECLRIQQRTGRFWE